MSHPVPTRSPGTRGPSSKSHRSFMAERRVPIPGRGLYLLLTNIVGIFSFKSCLYLRPSFPPCPSLALNSHHLDPCGSYSLGPVSKDGSPGPLGGPFPANVTLWQGFLPLGHQTGLIIMSYFELRHKQVFKMEAHD